MSIEIAQKLKSQLTDKYVVVKEGVPELRRFSSLTGIVKTVNMSGRALVEFDGPVDIGWYDIDPQYLVVVEAPAKKAAPAKAAEPTKPAAATKPPAAAAAAMKPAPTATAKPAGKSPLEMARAQGAGTATAAPAAAKPAPAGPVAGAAPPAKKLSPLEMARQQGAGKPGGAPAASKPAPAPPAPAPAAAVEKAAPTPHRPQRRRPNRPQLLRHRPRERNFRRWNWLGSRARSRVTMADRASGRRPGLGALRRNDSVQSHAWEKCEEHPQVAGTLWSRSGSAVPAETRALAVADDALHAALNAG